MKMTANAHDTKKQADPQTVGTAFVKQYYHLLTKSPAQLHRFYSEESQWCHATGSQMKAPVCGQKVIHEEIVNGGYQGAHIDIDIGSIDCQRSLRGGVVVMVTGEMTMAHDSKIKPFVQSFFLAEQSKGYFVLNDTLRFVELPAMRPSNAAKKTDAAAVVPAPKPTPSEIKKQQPAQAAIGTPVKDVKSPKATKVSTPAPAPVSPVNSAKTPASPAPAAPSPATKVASPKAAQPSSPVKKQPAATTPASPAPAAVTSPKTKASASDKSATPKPAEKPAAAAPAEPEKPAAPKTWAQLFMAGQAASSPAPAAAPKAPAVAAPKPQQQPASPKAKPSPSTEGAPKEKQRYHSVYIRDVPPQTKESDVRELFKPYGTIANITVNAARGFAFVDYYDQESMRAAVAEGNEFKLFDKVLHVDERTERKDGQRGGFRSNDTRGRGRGGHTGAKPRPTTDRKDRDDNKQSNNSTTRSTNGPRSNNATDRRDKGGRRGGKVESSGRGAN